MEPPGHQRSMTSYDPKMIFEILTPKKHPLAFKTIVTCSTRRKEHAGRWNFALAPSEAKLLAITGFRHFSALDLTSEVTGWPRTLSLYINLFVSWRATCSFFREALAQSGAKRQGGVVPPLVPCKDAKWPAPARVKVLLQFTCLEVLYDSYQFRWHLLERRAQINESRVTKNWKMDD